jgi:hypothetical protein
MKKLFISSVLLLLLVLAKAQSVAINTDGSTADSSAILDVKSTNKGVLIPRVTLNQKNAIASPATGLLVFQTNSTKGFYFYNGSAWVALSPKGVDNALDNLTPTAVNQSVIPGVNDSLDLGSNSLGWRNAYLTRNALIGGRVGIGTNAPRMPLHISSATGYGMVIENPVALNTGVTSGLYFKTSNQYYGAIKAVGTSNNSGRLGFFTFSGADSTALSERLSITDNGFVGINTTAPTQQLEVNGSAKVDGNLSTNGGVTAGTTLNVGTTATISSNLTVSGSSTLSGGAAVTGSLTDDGFGAVVNSNGTQMKVIAFSATLSITNLAPNSLLGAVGHITIAGGTFSGTPTAYVGNVLSASENGDWYRAIITADNVTATGVDIRIFNPTASTISFSNVTWKVLVIGPK